MEKCSLPICEIVADTYKIFYRSLPDSMAVPMILQKMEAWRSGIQEPQDCQRRDCKIVSELSGKK